MLYIATRQYSHTFSTETNLAVPKENPTQYSKAAPVVHYTPKDTFSQHRMAYFKQKDNSMSNISLNASLLVFGRKNHCRTFVGVIFILKQAANT